MSEVVISAGTPASADAVSAIQIWEPLSGTQLAGYKGIRGVDQHRLVQAGQERLVAVPAGERPSMLFYECTQEQPKLRCSLGDSPRALATTSDGAYLFAGFGNGTLCVWQLATGALLKTWTAHYKAVSALALTEGEAHLVSGGEDAIVQLWTVASIVNQSDSAPPVATRAWTGHTLPITGIHCGLGGFRGRIVTSSLDRTCMVWETISDNAVCSLVYPTFITSLVMDTAERSLYCGSGDGRIFVTDLIQGPTHGQPGKDHRTFFGHSDAVTSLTVNSMGNVLVSASQDGTCRVWDTSTGQLIKVYSSHRGPASSVKFVPKPDFLTNKGRDNRFLVPLVPIKRYAVDDNSGEVPVCLAPARVQDSRSTDPMRKAAADMDKCRRNNMLAALQVGDGGSGRNGPSGSDMMQSSDAEEEKNRWAHSAQHLFSMLVGGLTNEASS